MKTQIELLLDEVRAEREHFRSALVKIEAIENKEWGSDWEEIDEAREIAREALKCAK